MLATDPAHQYSILSLNFSHVPLVGEKLSPKVPFAPGFLGDFPVVGDLQLRLVDQDHRLRAEGLSFLSFLLLLALMLGW